MITVSALTKTFDGFQALGDLTINVKQGSIYGLIGINGSGKTTALKIITGILRPDSGSVTMGGEAVYENLAIKRRMGFIPDELWFFGSYKLSECAKFYSKLYPEWSAERYRDMTEKFGLPENRKLNRFSKGMQKQAAFILTMSSNPDFLVLDEPIDGLDPLIRKLVWKYIVDDVATRRMTVLVSSHNLREMEGICDSIGILDKGKMLMERELDELKSDIHKIQVAYPDSVAQEGRYEGLNVLHKESKGSIDLVIVRSPRELVDSVIYKNSPLLFDVLPLSLEEIFIYELGGGLSERMQILF
ncbi:MAG: ABC transporter ATP-binding protein [Oscillospiraceae bacterium]|jgi:ABC-2 type transport system ATP-binding protein|nr:ABC transporter ATP-binding protein [Oscillospiraceae bacterium]